MQIFRIGEYTRSPINEDKKKNYLPTKTKTYQSSY